MSRIGSKPKTLRDALLHDRQQFSHSLFRVRRIDKVEVAAFDTGKIGHEALVDAMGVGDDPAFGRLAEDLGQAHDRHRTRGDDVGQHLPRPDRRQLINVADKQQCRLVRQGSQQSPHQGHVDHRGFVDDKQIAVERRLLARQSEACLAFQGWVPRLSDERRAAAEIWELTMIVDCAGPCRAM